MPLFNYSGRNARGEVMEGQVESPNPQAVASWMLTAGITPIRIREQQDDARPEWLRKILGEKALTDIDLLLFTRQMGVMVKAGVPMMQALAAIQKSTRKPRLVRLLQALRDDLDKGHELSAAIARFPKFFNEYYINMVKVGEGTGKLEEIFRRLFVQLEFEKHMKQKIKGAVRYPSFVMTAILLAAGILNLYVIPVFARVYAGFKVSLPPLTLLLIAISNFVVDYWWALVAGAVLAAYGFRSWTNTPDGRYTWDKNKLHIPIIGSILLKGTVARFSLSLAIASRSGIPLMQAFTLVSRVVENAYFGQRIIQMRDGVERGESMLRVAQSAGIFTPLELQMIAVGEETGEIDEMLEQVAKMYQDEVEYEVDRLSESLEPILIGCAAVLVMILLLGIFVPLWDLGQVALHKKT
ncbi:MAG TPA: type II secretion system F family protein [Burkholderiales bacterium]|jgi:MSHA biogenesis protein MshG|nr:type II secretion system F family protein [Burkholderiales bacterium]